MFQPPEDLMREWCKDRMPAEAAEAAFYLAQQAAQWGADQELNACCQWLPKLPPWSANDLRKHRRTNAPSMKKQALEALESTPKLIGFEGERNVIRCALEQLKD